MGYASFVQGSGPLRVLIPGSTVFISCCAILGLTTNGLLIASILRQKSLRRSPTFLMLLSLACSDVLVLGYQPLFLYFLFTGGIYESLCQVFLYSAFASLTSSTYHLVAFAIIRYILLAKPLFATKHVTAKSTVIICILIWILSLGVPAISPLFTGITTFNVSANNTVDICLVDLDARFFTVSLLVTLTILPVTSMLVFHILKGCKIKAKPPEPLARTRRRQVSTKVIIGILVVFTASTLPSGVLWNVILLKADSISVELVVFAYLLTALQFANSAINPLMYFFFSDKARKSVCMFAICEDCKVTKAEGGNVTRTPSLSQTTAI